MAPASLLTAAVRRLGERVSGRRAPSVPRSRRNRGSKEGMVMKALSKSLMVMGVTLALGASIASAQTPVKFGLGGGVTIPSGSTSDLLKTGWHGMGLIQFKPAASPVGFQIDGAYQELKFDLGGGKEQIINGTGNVVYEFQVS